MKNDKVFYVNKVSKILYELGEITTGFNMGFTIDGTKDSCKVEVWSGLGNEIEPYTIIFHKNTRTWWIVSNDRVERYRSEQGYIYKHSLQLLGAIELLNARDLTDCGFYQDTYTIEQFFYRLLELSTFEFDKTEITINSGGLNIKKNIDYIKTFENYTLLSAIRELFDAYNCAVKLEFATRNEYTYTKEASGITSTNDIETQTLYLFGNTNFSATITRVAIDVFVNGVSTSHIYQLQQLTINGDTISIGGDTYTNQTDTATGNFIAIRFLSQTITVNTGSIGSALPYKITTNEVQEDYQVIGARFNIISKTGISSEVESESVFNNVKEIKSINKNSYGNVVMTNAENVISTKSKIYPAVGYVKLKSNEREINYNNAILRLPSNIYKVNYLQMVQKGVVSVYIYGGEYSMPAWEFYSDDEEDIKRDINYFMSQTSPGGNTYPQVIIDLVNENINDIAHKIALSMRTTLYTGWRYDAINNLYIEPNDNQDFYFPNVRKHHTIPPIEDVYNGKCVICEKSQRDTIQYPIGVCAYEKGKDTIELFQFLSNESTEYTTDFIGYGYTDLRISGDMLIIFNENPPTLYYGIRLTLVSKAFNYATVGNIGFRVNYIPMTDFKIKYDNSSTGNDMHLYNQNGKLNDSNALSKLILSYSKEIESDNITKYAEFNTYGNVPQAGQRISINNVLYVINNVSLDFYQNEDTSYYIVGEFTLSKSIAVKSIMISPNTDIRDYGIPQKYNVKRKQLYRDFFELNHSVDVLADSNYYLPLNKILNLTEMYVPYTEHTAVMKLVYANPTGGNISEGGSNSPSDTWYYQLDSTTYVLKKAIYEVIEFKDNNIIGYSSMNASSGFDVSKIFTGMATTINTPITYTDDNGNVESFSICMCNSEQLSTIYDTYQEIIEQDAGETYDGKFINDFFFIPSEIYEGEEGNEYGAKDNCDFIISETNYNKDAIEVPVFEYTCQVDDSEDVIIGDNILDTFEDDMFYVYKIVAVEKNTRDNNNWDYNFDNVNALQLRTNVDDEKYVQSTNIIKFDYSGDSLLLGLYQSCTYNIDTRKVNYALVSNWTDFFTTYPKSSYDYMIYRLTVKNNYKTHGSPQLGYYVNNTADLMFIIKNAENINMYGNAIELKINHFKIK